MHAHMQSSDSVQVHWMKLTGYATNWSDWRPPYLPWLAQQGLWGQRGVLLGVDPKLLPSLGNNPRSTDMTSRIFTYQYYLSMVTCFALYCMRYLSGKNATHSYMHCMILAYQACLQCCVAAQPAFVALSLLCSD